MTTACNLFSVLLPFCLIQSDNINPIVLFFSLSFLAN